MAKQIYPCLWFDGNAKEAATFYCSVFDHSEIISENPVVVMFHLFGEKMMGLNGGPMFRLNPSVSFMITSETEKETEDLYAKLSDGGMVMMPLAKYGWSPKYAMLQDKFGVSWQLYTGKKEHTGNQVISPTLLFTGKYCGKAEEAVHFYTTLFPHSEKQGILHYAPGDEDREDLVKHAQFKLNNYVMMAMDSSAPHNFSFNEAVSFVVNCDSQDEIDYYWNNLVADGGEEQQCGWLKDKFGVSWQIVPTILGELMNDPSRSEKVIQSFLKMRKFDIATLLNA